MASINSTQDQEVTYLTGVTASGAVAATSFWTWNNDEPATYGSSSDEAKWGAATAGTGATITYAFAAAANWTATEQSAFNATLSLWSAFANVTFTEVSPAASSEVVFTRASDGTAEGGINYIYPGNIGSTALGTAVSGSIAIDTSVAGFGPLGSSFSNFGGYPWTTLLHEEGHVLGLGHGGPYDEGVTTDSPQFTRYDTQAYSVMSYNDPTDANWGVSQATDGNYYSGDPTTPMMLDIAAVQRVYGLPTSTPFDGGQVFGFHDNIVGPTEPFYDFTVNTQPIVTLWDEGTGNTLDVSGFSQGSTVDLDQGAFSSVAGLTDNIGIAYGARIDGAVTGAAADLITANADGDTIFAGAGDDTVHGAAGADQIYGNAGNDVLSSGGGADSLFGGQGDDLITGGAGAGSYLSGDLGDDTITAGSGADTLIGAGGDDSLIGGPGHDLIFGNMGNDFIDLTHAGSSTVYGGQGNDVLTDAGNANAMQINGDAGDDTITGGTGGDMLLGGDGNDHVTGGSGAAQVFGNAGDDILVASGGASTVYGGQGDDVITVQNTGVGAFLSGDLGDDTITGGAGADTIIGGGGQDVLAGGGGANVFVYSAISDSAVAAPDHITDFNQSLDHVNLVALNAAQMAAGGPALSFVSAFDGHADEVTLSYNSASNQTALLIDANGDKTADFDVLLHGQVTQGGWLIL